MSEPDYLLSIHCMTFNQAKYITDAMNGFCMQKTTFPFVALIVDDNSTDGEQDVIKSYLDDNFDMASAQRKETEDAFFIEANHKENKSCHFVVVLLKQNMYRNKPKKLSLISQWENSVKYRAVCEGDDYWTDPLKLQKQVDFLEEHLDYSLCCHRYKVYNQNEGTWDDDYVKKLFEEQPGGFSFGNMENLNKAWITKTLTLVFRRDCYHAEDLKHYKHTCDEHHCYHLLKNGKGYCFPFFGGVYRRCDSGVFSVLSDETRKKRFLLIRTEMLKYNKDDRALRDCLFVRIRKNLSSHEMYKELRSAIMVCLNSFYHTDGFYKTVCSLKRIIGSYVYGLKKSCVAKKSN